MEPTEDEAKGLTAVGALANMPEGAMEPNAPESTLKNYTFSAAFLFKGKMTFT